MQMRFTSSLAKSDLHTLSPSSTIDSNLNLSSVHNGLNSLILSPIPSHSRDGDYFQDDGPMEFTIENTKFRAHRNKFVGYHLDDDMPTMFKQVKASDFTVFLNVPHSTIVQPFQPNSPEEWLSVLLVAHTLGHTPLRQVAISHLTNILSALDRVVYGKRYNVGEWLTQAYLELCQRPKPLSLEESERLGIEDTVEVFSLMLEFGKGNRSQDEYIRKVRSTFGLEP